jgi:hypothetical protein
MHQSNPSMSILHPGAFASVAFACKPLPGVRHLKLILYFLKIANKLKHHNHISLSKCIMSISCDKQCSQIMSLIIVCSTGNKSYGSNTPRCFGKHPVTIGDCSLNLTHVTNSIFLPLIKPLMSVYLSNKWLDVMPCKNARWYSIIVRSIITHGFN